MLRKQSLIVVKIVDSGIRHGFESDMSICLILDKKILSISKAQFFHLCDKHR